MDIMYNLQKTLIALYLIHFNMCHGNNWHYSLSSIYELFNLEVEHIIATETYIKNEYKRLENIRKFIEQRKKQNEKELAESYTESSINAFKTILRIKNDWETLKNRTAQTTAIGEFKDKSVTYDNIVSGLKAIRRLQIIYELDAQDISNWNISGHPSQPFDVNDCYDMASLCYDNAEYHCAYWWFVEVYDRNNEDVNQLKFDYSTFITKFAWSSYLVGDIDGAMYILNKYAEETNEINDDIMNMRFTVWAGNIVFKRNTADDHDKKFYSYSLQKLDSEKEVSKFKTACQNITDLKNSQFKCRYYHGGRKYFMIGPLREEIVSLIPSMKLYHNVLYDDEIKKIKELANPKLERLSIDTNEDISLRKVASFRKHNNQVFETIHQRFAQISSNPKTNLVDKYVVTNYGIGGHYLPHTKYIDDDHLINSKGREAIVIIHMDDVPEGGATVLPDLEVCVRSVKGSALVIYNTKNTFTPMEELLKFAQYGTCPIVYGDKWTCDSTLEQNNYTLGVEDVVFMLLETLKSNGTFDEIRGHCITDIDAKLTYQNWKQCIESIVNKFLSKVKFTPELNKNTVRECLRKHLLDGCETQDIEEGADKILTQVLAPHSLNIFEPKIAVAVDEYLVIENEAPSIEINRLKESSMNLIKASNIEISTVVNPKIDFISNADNIMCDKTLKGDRKNLRSDKNKKSSSLCKESKSLKGNQSEDANCAVGSSKQKCSQLKTSTSDKSKSSSSNHKSSIKDKICKKVVEKSKNIVEKCENVINNHKDVVNKSKDVSKPKDIVDQSKDNVNKPRNIVDKSKKKSFLSKNFNSNSSSHKSNRTDMKGTKCSLEKKKKSSSLCKEHKLLNGNRSDDERNSGGSSKQKSTTHKNKSSSSDKTKSSSSNHKSSRRDNNSTDIVERPKHKSLSKNSSSIDIINKSKDKLLPMFSDRTVDNSKNKYLSKNSSSSSHKSNHTDTKRLKLSPVEKNKSPTNKVNDGERKPEKTKKSELNDFRNSIHSNNDIDVIMKDSASILSNQILHEEIENNGAKVLDNDKSLYTFKGFSEADAIPCKNDQILKNVIKTLQILMNSHDTIDNGFKGFTSAETNQCKHQDNVYAELIKMKESESNTGFIGFSKKDTAMSVRYQYVVKQLELTKKRKNVDNHQQNVKCGGNGIQNGKSFNEVMAAHLYKNNNDNHAKSKNNSSTPTNDKKKDSPTVNNNNHNYDSWVVEQEIKYKLLPVKVKLERLIIYGCNNANSVSDSPQDQKEVYLFNGYDQQTEL